MAIIGQLATGAPDVGMAISSRRAERARVQLPADLRKVGETRVKVEVLDISTLGFRIETHRKLRVNTPVWLTLPGLQPIPARVVRQSGPDIGCEFQVPLHPAVLDQVIAAGR